VGTKSGDALLPSMDWQQVLAVVLVVLMVGSSFAYALAL
jgi:hypothetical protein